MDVNKRVEHAATRREHFLQGIILLACAFIVLYLLFTIFQYQQNQNIAAKLDTLKNKYEGENLREKRNYNSPEVAAPEDDECYVGKINGVCLSECSKWSLKNFLGFTKKSSEDKCLASCMSTIGCRSISYDEETGKCTQYKKCFNVRSTSQDCCEKKSIFNLRCHIEVKPAVYGGCDDVKKSGRTSSGLYNIRINSKTTVPLYCDLDVKGGWTVLQRRMDGSVDFYRGWDDYKRGFGKPDGEFWIGLDNLHEMTSKRNTKLRVKLTSWDGEMRQAVYNVFKVADESQKYKLTVSGHSGNLSDSLTAVHNSSPFSTKDQDNDFHSSVHCAIKSKGAWWYNNCHNSNLNGLYYQNGIYSDFATGACWKSWKGYHYSYKFLVMELSY